MIERNSENIHSLQAGRALAALAVAVSHAASSTVDFVGPMPTALGNILEHGWLGVDFFFVLSGFIIYHSTRAKPKGVAGAQSYARSRLTRIFVPYLPVSILLMLAYALLPSLSSSDRQWSAVASLTLLPVGEPALLVAWTLQHEIIFYTIFALGFFTGRLWLIIGMWAAAIFAGMALDAHPACAPLKIMIAPINIEFVFGIGSALLVGRPATVHGAVFVILAAAAFSVWALLDFSRAMSPIAGLGIAALIVPMVRCEQAGRFSLRGWLVYLGAASYAIYLVHDPLLSATARIAARTPLLSDVYTATIFGLVVATLVGCLYHSLFEKPARDWMLRRSKRSAAVRS
jgi:exopolysaccharide production protein ExoZ